ncbi:MAG: hypothetical protein WBG86_04290 [Polyangiales bacterium]
MRLPAATAVLSLSTIFSACDSSNDGPFEVDDVEFPETVVSDGPRGDLTIYWSGNPTFPVTGTFGPTADGCPVPGSCNSRELSFEEEENPIVFVGSPKCSGYTEDTVIGYQVQLIDAEDVVTAPFPVTYLCVLE